MQQCLSKNVVNLPNMFHDSSVTRGRHQSATDDEIVLDMLIPKCGCEYARRFTYFHPTFLLWVHTFGHALMIVRSSELSGRCPKIRILCTSLVGPIS